MVDGSVFRHVVGHFASGVSIVTTHHDGRDYGMTVSAVTSLSLEPPMMLVCLNRAVPTEAAVRESGFFCVNILDDRQGPLAGHFARPAPDKFAGLAHDRGPGGAPTLPDALATIACQVEHCVPAGTHTVFLGRVLDAAARDGMPLTYFRGGFGTFALDRYDEAYSALRSMVLRRDVPVNALLDIAQLAQELDYEPDAIVSALTRLAGDRLVRLEPTGGGYAGGGHAGGGHAGRGHAGRGHAGGGYVVAPFDIATAEDAFDARCVIELGAVELTVGTLTPAQLGLLDALLARLTALIVDDQFVDFDSYLVANHEFHRYLVSLTSSRSLTATYEQLQLPSVMALSFGSTTASSNAFVRVHEELAAAYRAGDVAGARSAVRTYAELAKRRARDVLTRAGGTI
jgi:flavin reductase (DIM6/NTAB) family NADH-FMN oxidoreductase RutF/DNA-binding GntR family transcriptional regulator